MGFHYYVSVHPVYLYLYTLILWCGLTAVWTLWCHWAVGRMTPVISLFPHKRQCQHADTLFTKSHNEGQSEAVILWRLSREAFVCLRQMQKKNTNTPLCDTNIDTPKHINETANMHEHTCINTHGCMQTQAHSQWHKASSAQLWLGLMWTWSSRQKRLFRSITHGYSPWSLCLSLSLCHSLSLSVSAPITVP